MSLGEGSRQLRAGLHIFGVWHSHELLKSFNPFYLLAGFRFGKTLSVALAIFGGVNSDLQFLANIFSHQCHFIDDLLFVMKSAKRPLQLFIEPLEVREERLALPR